MRDYEPPFHMTDRITSLIAEISEQVGRITVLQGDSIGPHLRSENRIRTIHSSLAIEHKRLHLSHRPTFRKNYLQPALEQDLIERTIPDKPNSKHQKYRKHEEENHDC